MLDTYVKLQYNSVKVHSSLNTEAHFIFLHAYSEVFLYPRVGKAYTQINVKYIFHHFFSVSGKHDACAGLTRARADGSCCASAAVSPRHSEATASLRFCVDADGGLSNAGTLCDYGP